MNIRNTLITFLTHCLNFDNTRSMPSLSLHDALKGFDVSERFPCRRISFLRNRLCSYKRVWHPAKLSFCPSSLAHTLCFTSFRLVVYTFIFSKVQLQFNLLSFILSFRYNLNMKFSVLTTFTLVALASAIAIEEYGTPVVRREVLLERQGANENRPVPTGACCVAATSLKEDVCFNNGQSGRCVPDSVNNCGLEPVKLRLLRVLTMNIGGTTLTCIEDSRLTCDAAVLERGRPTCRRTPGA